MAIPFRTQEEIVGVVESASHAVDLSIRDWTALLEEITPMGMIYEEGGQIGYTLKHEVQDLFDVIEQQRKERAQMIRAMLTMYSFRDPENWLEARVNLPNWIRLLVENEERKK